MTTQGREGLYPGDLGHSKLNCLRIFRFFFFCRIAQEWRPISHGKLIRMRHGQTIFTPLFVGDSEDTATLRLVTVYSIIKTEQKWKRLTYLSDPLPSKLYVQPYDGANSLPFSLYLSLSPSLSLYLPSPASSSLLFSLPPLPLSHIDIHIQTPANTL